MPIPLRMSLAWKLISIVEREGILRQPADKIRAASDRRKDSTKLPGAWLVVGRTDPRVIVQDTEMVTPEGVVLPLRIYRPRDVSAPCPVVLNFHGGGFVSGDVQQSQWWASTIAAETRTVVVSVEYRLAPEHPFPAAPEDCYAATVWVSEHAADLDIDPSRIAVMGDSAGGNLAAVVSVMSRDRGGPSIALQVLLYPATEMLDDFPSKFENAHAPVLQAEDMDAVPLLYFSGANTDKTDPYASPLRAKHEGLPPALIQTAQFDPLRDDGAAYAEALRAAGVPVRYTNYVDAVHGYISLPGLVPQARQALTEAAHSLREALHT